MKNKIKVLWNNILWGFLLWLFGYVLGIIFLAITKDPMVIGWYIMPLGIVATLWVLFKKIKRDSFLCYFGVGFIWTVLAIFLDYFLIVKLFKVASYYKLDVYLYYILTFVLPIVVGYYKKTKRVGEEMF